MMSVMLLRSAMLVVALISPWSACAQTGDVPWSRAPIYSIAATNRPHFQPVPVDPYKVALRELDEPFHVSLLADTNTALSPTRIYLLEPDEGDVAAAYEQAAETEDVRALVREADRLSRSGDTEEAEGLLLGALPQIRSPEHKATLYGRLGHYLFRANKMQEAAEYMKLAIVNRPSDPRLASNLAAALLTLGQLDDAEQLLGRINLALEFDPSLIFSVHFNLACIHSLRNDPDLAFAALTRAAESDPISTFASLGDTQLDNLRLDPRFQRVQEGLDLVLKSAAGQAR